MKVRKQILTALLCISTVTMLAGCSFGKKDGAGEAADGNTNVEIESTSAEEPAVEAEGAIVEDVSIDIAEPTETVSDNSSTEATEPVEPAAQTDDPVLNAKAKNTEALTGVYASTVEGLADSDYYALVSAGTTDVLLVAQSASNLYTPDYVADSFDVYYYDGTEVVQLGRIVSDAEHGYRVKRTPEGYFISAGCNSDSSFPFEFMKIKVDPVAKELSMYEYARQDSTTAYTYIAPGTTVESSSADSMAFDEIKAIYDNANSEIYFNPKTPEY